MINKEFFAALDLLETEKKIPKSVFIETLENALALAYKKQYGTSKAIEVLLLPEKNAFKINAYANKDMTRDINRFTRFCLTCS